MTSAQVVETSVTTNNSLSQDYTQPDDHSNSRSTTPGFKPFTLKITLTDEPWRKTLGWQQSVRDDLKTITASIAPAKQGEFLNIVLAGQIGAGKSIFFNSLNSIFEERVVAAKAKVGLKGCSLTSEFRIYEIKPKHGSNPLPWRICDTMGLQSDYDDDYEVRNILMAVDGHIPDRFKFPYQEVTQDSKGDTPSPDLKDRAHCVAVVIDCRRINYMKDNTKRKLKNLKTGLDARDIPTYILLTHVDKACEEVAKDVKTVYRSIVIRDLVSKVGKMLQGLPENQIFPVVNYIEQVELDKDMDILLLYALRQMLYSAQAHLES